MRWSDAATSPLWVAPEAIALIRTVDGGLTSVTGYVAYDTIAFYDAEDARDAAVVVPPIRTALVSRRGPWSRPRERAIPRMTKVGRRR